MTDAARSKADRPSLTIGVPLFNAERFLPAALDSLLSQTYTDFELVISDNASTDSTPEICREVAARDRRVRYIPQQENIGAPRNWNVLVHEARGVYFKWASGSDVCKPEMVAKCIDVLEKDKDIAICYGQTQFIDEHGQQHAVYEDDDAFDDDHPGIRFARICLDLRLNNMQSGVIRLDALRQTKLDRMYPSGDMVLMAELALYGKFAMIPEVLLYRRQVKETYTALMGALERQRVYTPSATRPMRFIIGRRHFDYFSSVARWPGPFGEKRAGYSAAIKRTWREKRPIYREFRAAVRSLFPD